MPWGGNWRRGRDSNPPEADKPSKGGQALLGRGFTRLRRASSRIFMAQPNTTLTGFQKLLSRPRSGMVRKHFYMEECECTNNLRALCSVVPMLNKSSLKVVCDPHVPLTSACPLKNVNGNHDVKDGGGGGIRTLDGP